MTPSIWKQLNAFGGSFFTVFVASMSGLLGLVFTLLMFIWPEKYGRLVFGVLSLVAALSAAFFVWREQYLVAHDLRIAGEPTLHLGFGDGGSYFYKHVWHQPECDRPVQMEERLFRVSIRNSGTRSCRASVVVRGVRPGDLPLANHRLSFMDLTGPNEVRIGEADIAPGLEPTAYVDLVAEQTSTRLMRAGHEFRRRTILLPFAAGGYVGARWDLDEQRAPESFDLDVRLDGGPQSAFASFHCSVEDGSLSVRQIPDVSLLKP